MTDSLGPLGSRRVTISSLMDALATPLKRKVYYSFHFDDIMRVNNVRQAWKINHPNAQQMRSFYDRSLWERRQLNCPDPVKTIIRDGVEYASVVCVLAGSETWSRRWVRYEIARGVIDGLGLLAVHLNAIPHHERRVPDFCGPNPLSYMAVGKVQSSIFAAPQYFLFEWNGQSWIRYEDYTNAVNLPRYLADPAPDYVMPLSTGTFAYDYIKQVGHENSGSWIDQAARRVGR
jgi:MTH538 TIR-like domain (DUF1863)